LLVDEQDYAGASALLEQNGNGGAFMPRVEELRGDILVAQGKPEEARLAYGRSLASTPPQGGGRQRLQMKLDDLGKSADQTEAVPGQKSP
jgi:predicted negative regulator of RcsB-dependent stress response